LLVCLGICLLSTPSFATNCDINKSVGNTTGFNGDCTDSGKPYCTITDVTAQPPTFTCVECISPCDCSPNEYCSREPGKIGTCRHFSKYASSCRPLTSLQIANQTFPEKWKCAMTFTYNNTYYVDQEGSCSSGTCRYCKIQRQGGPARGLPRCNVNSGRGVERICNYPGTQTSLHGARWFPGFYYEQVQNVWFAIFFCFFIIAAGVQTAIAVVTYKKGGAGGSSSGGSSNATTEIKRETKRDSIKTAQPAHSTISPAAQTEQRASTEIRPGSMPMSESQPPPYSAMDVEDAPKD